MFYRQIKALGRPPSGYKQLDLTDPEQLAIALLKTLPSNLLDYNQAEPYAHSCHN